MLYVRYINKDPIENWRRVVSVYPTQTTANAGTVGDSAYTAAVDATVDVYWWVNISTGAVQKNNPRVLSTLQTTLRTAYFQFDAWEEALDDQKRYWPDEDIKNGHNWLYWGGHRSAYIVSWRRDLTDAQKIAWAERVVRGATSITNVGEFLEAVHGQDTDGNRIKIVPPDQPRTWVNPFNAVALSLDTVRQEGGKEIRGVSPYSNNADGSTLSTDKVPEIDIKLIAGGLWIYDVPSNLSETPGAMAAPTLTTRSTIEIGIEFVPPSDIGGSAITGYDVRYRVSGATEYTVVTPSLAANIVTATITGLTESTTYNISVRANNSFGNGVWSPDLNIATT